MLYQVFIKEGAHQDVIEAYNYYEEKQQGLGDRFLDALSKRYYDLMLHPTHYSFIPEDEKQILRDVKIPKFPFVIVFEILFMNVIVYAVHNTYKNPYNKLRSK